MDKQSCPAIVCCGGRMDFHGAPLSRTWVKLGATAKKGDTDRHAGRDRSPAGASATAIIVTSDAESRLRHAASSTRGTASSSADRVDTTLTLDAPLEFAHTAGSGDFRGEVANLSRNVVVESADPKRRARPHHVPPPFRRLDQLRRVPPSRQEGVLGRYAMHYHLVGDTMRGSYVIGASIWDSDNRWLTIHGTNYLVVRDCVGYQSIGHGFFLEDGTEVYNVLDRNLAVQALRGKPLPKQVLPFDDNDGAGFWWANSLNTFTRNVACENDHYGYRFEATDEQRPQAELAACSSPTAAASASTSARCRSSASTTTSRTADGLYGFNLGEGVDRVGPDTQHPFIVRNMKIWEIALCLPPAVAVAAGRGHAHPRLGLRRLSSQLRQSRLPQRDHQRQTAPSRSTAATTTTACSTAR